MRYKTENGTSAVEFAIVLPILVVLLFGIIEFSILLYDKAIITNASREGARAGIVFKSNPVTEEYLPVTEDEIETVVNNYVSNNLITFGSSTTPITKLVIPYKDNDGSGDPSSGDDLMVTVSYTYGFLLLPNFITSLGGNINVGAVTVMRME
jgi:hypothetical protein